jgi:DNA polymerase III subunit chi
MTDIQFYHLLSTPLEVALPKLVAMAYAKEMRVCIVAEAAQQKMLDDTLWTFQANSFLPHGLAEDAQAIHHPIVIAAAPTQVNDATLLILTDGSTVQNPPYERVFDMFNGNDAGAVQAARVRWKQYLDAGIDLTYIKQRADGGWDKMKETKA